MKTTLAFQLAVASRTIKPTGLTENPEQPSPIVNKPKGIMEILASAKVVQDTKPPNPFASLSNAKPRCDFKGTWQTWEVEKINNELQYQAMNLPY